MWGIKNDDDDDDDNDDNQSPGYLCKLSSHIRKSLPIQTLQHSACVNYNDGFYDNCNLIFLLSCWLSFVCLEFENNLAIVSAINSVLVKAEWMGLFNFL